MWVWLMEACTHVWCSGIWVMPPPQSSSTLTLVCVCVWCSGLETILVYLNLNTWLWLCAGHSLGLAHCCILYTVAPWLVNPQHGRLGFTYLEILEGHPKVIHCRVRGRPTPEIWWEYSNHTLISLDNSSRIYATVDAQLFLDPPLVRDGMILFICRASNPAGMLWEAFLINVYIPGI